ncbi:hypothetical protein PHLCEN_2v10429 [Hermanssonia centrifuga]|uniref:Uncharacterized protein n=1 Tax=Hermanssonia centrifuga TaxID=98765 RepID=A0A2R6NMX8_9APHY|nr:hypothetical protein PHLCEN_2v10429 [Hermanssonia centrifuga]
MGVEAVNAKLERIDTQVESFILLRGIFQGGFRGTLVSTLNTNWFHITKREEKLRTIVGLRIAFMQSGLSSFQVAV